MPFIPMNLNDSQETRPVSSGKYDVVVSSCEETKTKAEGRPQFKMSLAIECRADAPNVMHYASIPSEGDDIDKAKFKALLLRRLMALFQVPVNPKGIDTEKLAMEFVGKRASVELSLTEPDDNGNVYNRLMVPKLKAEGEEGRGRASPPKRAA